MGNHYDFIVIGVGGMGSATVYHLARRGHKVLGLEQYDIPHEMGSSHGITRIIRLAYYEHPSYVALLRRAYALWRELEAETGEKVLHITGSVDAGPPDSQVFKGSLESCKLHELPHEVLTSHELTARYPGYRLPEDTMALFQPAGGFLTPERCIVTHVQAAQTHGADLRAREGVTSWEIDGPGVKVHTTRSTYTADKVVFTAGAWLGKLVPDMQQVLQPIRQVLIWMQPHKPDWFTPERFPVFNLLVDEGRYYGLPIYGIPGFKLGRYQHLNQPADPDTLDRAAADAEDERVLRSMAERYFPDATGPTMSMKVCMFTNTPDEHFILDIHPEHPQIVIGSPCSGHGFKFSSVMGEILADLAEKGDTGHDIDLLRLARLRANLSQ
jgi:sarcosine oxidase